MRRVGALGIGVSPLLAVALLGLFVLAFVFAAPGPAAARIRLVRFGQLPLR